MQGIFPEEDHNFYLGPELNDVYNAPFWFNFIQEAERRLSFIGAISRGTADGDLSLPGCRYCSLRNEAYVRRPIEVPSFESKSDSGDGESKTVKIEPTSLPPPPPVILSQLVYPPNDAGYNAAEHPNPILDVIFFLKALHDLSCRVNELESMISLSSP
jgi:hypothetical protein